MPTNPQFINNLWHCKDRHSIWVGIIYAYVIEHVYKKKGNYKRGNNVAVYLNYKSPNIIFATTHDSHEASFADLVSFSIANVVTIFTTTK